MPKYQVEALRTIRVIQVQHERAGHDAQAEQMRKVGDQVERMVEELADAEWRVEVAVGQVAGLQAELAALKEAARHALMSWSCDCKAENSEMFKRLARMCGEE